MCRRRGKRKGTEGREEGISGKEGEGREGEGEMEWEGKGGHKRDIPGLAHVHWPLVASLI